MDKVLGLDLGTVTVGIAASDILGIVHPVKTFKFPHRKYDLAVSEIMNILAERDIKEIVIGMPLRLNGKDSDMSKDVEAFITLLKEKNPSLIIETMDERLSTVQAHKSINMMGLSHDKRKAVVDQISAVEILDAYLRKKEYANGR